MIIIDETQLMLILFFCFLFGAAIAMGIVVKFLKPLVDEQQELLEEMIQKYKEDCL